MSDEWKDEWITSIHKKGSKEDCNNYRGLTVISTISRLYKNIPNIIKQEEYRPYEARTKYHPCRSTIDNIFCLTQVIAKSLEILLLFVDLTQAYDRIPLSKLWIVLESSNINITIIKAINKLYHAQWGSEK